MVPRFLTEVIVMPFMPLKRNRRVFLSLVREINESNKFSFSKIFTSHPCDQALLIWKSQFQREECFSIGRHNKDSIKTSPRLPSGHFRLLNRQAKKGVITVLAVG